MKKTEFLMNLSSVDVATVGKWVLAAIGGAGVVYAWIFQIKSNNKDIKRLTAAVFPKDTRQRFLTKNEHSEIQVNCEGDRDKALAALADREDIKLEQILKEVGEIKDMVGEQYGEINSIRVEVTAVSVKLDERTNKGGGSSGGGL